LFLSAVLPCLLGLADKQQPAKLQEAVADCMCALASNDWAQQQLCDAGEVAKYLCLLQEMDELLVQLLLCALMKHAALHFFSFSFDLVL
jgi:hypothetical protein